MRDSERCLQRETRVRHLIIPLLAGGLIYGLYWSSQEATAPPVAEQAHQIASPFRLASGPDTVSVAPASTSLTTNSPAQVAGPSGGQQSGMAPIYDPQGNLVGYAPDPWLEAGNAPAEPTTVLLPGSATGPDLNAIPLPYMPVSEPSEIFRFDVTPDWVRGRWSRVSIVPADQGWQGLRVPLVTGTQSWDLHGSLTFLFDHRQRCRRIAFRGWTGNPQRLLDFLTQQYRFHELSQGAATRVWIAGRDQWPHGAVILKPMTSPQAASSPRASAILMELTPGQSWWDSSTPLSPEFSRLLGQQLQAF